MEPTPRPRWSPNQVSAETYTWGLYAETDGYMHLKAEPGKLKFKAGARARVSTERVRAKRSITSAEGNGPKGSAMIVEETDAEGLYAEGDGNLNLEAKPGEFKFEAGVRGTIGAGQVRAKRSINSAGARNAMVVTEGLYAEAGAHMNVEMTPERLGLEAKASAGHIRVTEDDVSVEASGPNASPMFVANNREAQVMVGAEIASASVSAGPVGVKVGLGVKTGARVGDDGAELKVLGCGMSVGRTTGVSLFGNELKFRLW